MKTEQLVMEAEGGAGGPQNFMGATPPGTGNNTGMNGGFGSAQPTVRRIRVEMGVPEALAVQAEEAVAVAVAGAGDTMMGIPNGDGGVGGAGGFGGGVAVDQVEQGQELRAVTLLMEGWAGQYGGGGGATNIDLGNGGGGRQNMEEEEMEELIALEAHGGFGGGGGWYQHNNGGTGGNGGFGGWWWRKWG